MQLLKIIRQNTTFSAAIAISVLLHGVLLAVRIVDPEAFKSEPTDPGLEVILVNSKHDKKPIKAQALAQANLDGGGNADAGRATSPLADMHKTEDGDDLKVAQRRVDELEEAQKMLAQAVSKTPFVVPKLTDQVSAHEPPAPNAIDKVEIAKALARREAEISKHVSDYNARPRKTLITPSTREVGYARFYNAMRSKIEKFGTLNYPQKDGQKLYGVLLVYVPVMQDGSIYEQEGGVEVALSSGIRALDEAAKRIVRRSAPFGSFPPEMRKTTKNEVWGMVYRFKFTREEGLETELRGNE